jgi:hypothetical protein
MNECGKETVLAWLEDLRRGERAVNHPFIERFIGEADVRKAAALVKSISGHSAGEKVFLPAHLLPPLD